MDDKHLYNLRHSLAHVLAAAVQELFPDAKFGVGPVIADGFYYDFQLPRTLTPEDLPKIEKRMKAIITRKLAFERKEFAFPEASTFFEQQRQPFKIELIKDLEKKGTTFAGEGTEQQGDEATSTALKAGKVSVYTLGKFDDLCRGGHVATTKEIPSDAFALRRVAGAYWRGDEKNPQLQRVYGVAFATQQELATYLEMLKEAEKRDHRKLGQQLGLFLFHPTAPGMPYWLPNGMILYNELVRFWREEHEARGYQEISSPLLNKKELYVTSGHYDHYWESMFTTKTGEDEEYGVKAMNCPNAMVVFKSQPRSYRDLPLRLADTDQLHRNEPSGTLNGLLRVRAFRQDDAHIYVMESQIEKEYEEVFKIVKRFYSIFDLDYSFRLGTRPKGFLGERSIWDKAEDTLKRILMKSKTPFVVAEGEGAFYGPKIDIMMKDSLGREWQMGTIQLDFQQPSRFQLAYADKDGKDKTPVAIHRVIYGSLERFIGILLEHTAGNLPTWLAPVQLLLVPVGTRHEKACQKLAKEFRLAGARVAVDIANETVGNKIRKASHMRIPYLLVIGDKELKATKFSIRVRGSDRIRTTTKKRFLEQLQEEIQKRK